MNENISTQKTVKRLFDLLAIVIVTLILLGLAWQVGQVASQTPVSRMDVSTEVEDLVAPPELQLHLPLERLGMVMTRETIPGDPNRAMTHLEELCRFVLTEADSWVLSLAITEDEQAMLNSIPKSSPLDSRIGSRGWHSMMFSTKSPQGLACVREYAGQPGDAASPARRLLCWGFILGEGTDSQTVWFARPREKLHGADARSSTTAPSSRE